jgi:hypothetical protein
MKLAAFTKAEANEHNRRFPGNDNDRLLEVRRP